MQPSGAGPWKPRNGTSEQVSGKTGMGAVSRSQAAVLCPPCLNVGPLQSCVMHTHAVVPVPASLCSPGPWKSWPWKSKLCCLLFGTSFAALESATAHDLNSCTRTVEVGLEKQHRAMQRVSVPGSTAPRSPALAPSRAAHPRVPGELCPRIRAASAPETQPQPFGRAPQNDSRDGGGNVCES